MHISEMDAMKRALALARKGEGKVYPNPMVGAVVVKDGKVIGEGWHKGPGQPHAEVEALKSCDTDSCGATLYVTLEPCNHYGRTPPCTEAIIHAGVREVKYAVADPNPDVAGGGAARLRRAGIEAEEGLLNAEAILLNKEYFYHCLTGRPWVIFKAGMSLDGKIALPDGSSQWITGSHSRKFVHKLRARVGAVVIGIGTALKDNPHLTVRDGGDGKRQPLKVVLDGELRMGADSNLVREFPEKLVVFCTERAPLSKEAQLLDLGAKVIRQTGHSKVNPVQVLESLGEMGVQSVVVEGGHQVYAVFVEEQLIHEYFLCYAPFFIGGDSAMGVLGGRGIPSLSGAPRVKIDSVRRSGEDFIVHAYRKGWEQECLPDWFKKSEES